MLTRREFLKSATALVGGAYIVTVAPQVFATAPAPVVQPPFDPDALAERILKGDKTAVEFAKGVPPRALNQVGERLYLKIIGGKENHYRPHKPYPKDPIGFPMTDEGKFCFQEFMCLKNLPWSTCDHICRRLAKRREEGAQKWLLGHKGLRERILDALGPDERGDRHSPLTKHWWRKSVMPRRVNTVDPVWKKLTKEDEKAISKAVEKERKENAKRYAKWQREHNIRFAKEQLRKAYLS